MMLRIAVPVLAILAVGYAATAWPHGFKTGTGSPTGPFMSGQAAARTTPLPLRDFPDLMTIFTEEN
jgi:hypothetical protein